MVALVQVCPHLQGFVLGCGNELIYPLLKLCLIHHWPPLYSRYNHTGTEVEFLFVAYHRQLVAWHMDSPRTIIQLDNERVIHGRPREDTANDHSDLGQVSRVGFNQVTLLGPAFHVFLLM
tara:strand:+ start:2730 stop:3089 length:360 start_codon:yes stop_codon:yes gene_type:complete